MLKRKIEAQQEANQRRQQEFHARTAKPVDGALSLAARRRIDMRHELNKRFDDMIDAFLGLPRGARDAVIADLSLASFSSRQQAHCTESIDGLNDFARNNLAASKMEEELACLFAGMLKLLAEPEDGANA
jgi:hypothetical protein